MFRLSFLVIFRPRNIKRSAKRIKFTLVGYIINIYNFEYLHTWPGVRIPTGERDFSNLPFIGYRLSILGVKWPGREVDCSFPSSAVVKNEWSYTTLPPYAFVAWTGKTFFFNVFVRGVQFVNSA
jgi:hypothetical protein